MSPLKIEMLLWIHTRVEPYNHRGGNAQRDAFEWFLQEGLIHAYPGRCEIYGGSYKTTDRGAAMVGALMSVKLPVCTWIQPNVEPSY